MNNVNDNFFDGNYKDVWKAIIPEQLTIREVQFIVSYFRLQPGDEVLDMMCGYGRHALGIAATGINVTAVDNLAEYINEIQYAATSQNLPINAVQKSVFDYHPSKKYKLVICMGNSLNFFNSADTAILFNNWASALDTGSYLLINSWSLAETIIPQFVETSQASHGGVSITSKSTFLFYPTRIETETQMVSTRGEIEVKLAIDYIYSVNEIQSMLEAAGFKLVEIYNIPGKKKFAVGDPRAYIIAQRN